MQLRSVTSTPDVRIAEVPRSRGAGLLQCIISIIKTIWNAVVALIQTIFCCRLCRNTTETSLEVRNATLINTFSESESEESSDAEIKISSPWKPDLRVYHSPAAKRRLLSRYQGWIRGQNLANPHPQNLVHLKRIAATSRGETAQFARMTHKILSEQPGIFTFFRLSILSDQHLKLEAGLATAVRTSDIEPLVTALYS